jgi:hypothetical protein
MKLPMADSGELMEFRLPKMILNKFLPPLELYSTGMIGGDGKLMKTASLD